MKAITESTPLSISLLIVLSGGLIFVGTISGTVAETSRRVQAVEAGRSHDVDKLDKILSELGEIRGELKTLKR